jgi:hypothetical protein
MPFTEDLSDHYSALKNAIDDEGFHPARLDRDIFAGDIREPCDGFCGHLMQ